MYVELKAAIASVAATLDIIKASKQLRESSELSAAVAEVNTKLLHVSGVALASQEKQAHYAARIQELERELMQLQDWRAEAQQYEPLEIATGLFAYVHKARVGSLQSAHKLCSNCFHQSIKSFLQQSATKERSIALTCNRCQSVLTFYGYSNQS